ncbi:MAG TPA: hypothetical protein VJU86_19300 [Pyrinomonadaceae bacterium]|nr:hypothetical protein [Pyrinomonadaceae bacterium]
MERSETLGNGGSIVQPAKRATESFVSASAAHFGGSEPLLQDPQGYGCTFAWGLHYARQLRWLVALLIVDRDLRAKSILTSFIPTDYLL